MQQISRYPFMRWQEANAQRFFEKYNRMQSGFHKLQIVIDKYWLPGQRNSDRLLLGCHARALNDAQISNHIDLHIEQLESRLS